MKTLCIYHGNCQDGFGAAWAIRLALESAVEFYPGVYQESPPDVTNREVILVDFSYKRPVLEEMSTKAKSIIVIDHHKSAEEDLEPFKVQLCGGAKFCWSSDMNGLWDDFKELNKPPIIAYFDMERSGAGLAWDCFHSSKRPRLIDHIEDRDLWRFKFPQTRTIAAAVFSYPYDFKIWDRLMQPNRLDTLHIEGAAIERKHHQDIANLLPVVQRQMTIGGINMPVACLPLTFTSDAGHKMATEADGIAACYWDTSEGRIFSLRSIDGGPNCQRIAVSYGGGGHTNAAGFRMPRNWEGDE